MNRQKKAYTQISNRLLNDADISLKAKGLFAFMHSKPKGWNFTIRSMAAQLKEGKRSIGSALNELKRAGYVIYQKHPSGEGTYQLIEYPNPRNPDLRFSNMAKRGRISNKDYIVKKIQGREGEFQSLFSLYRLHTKNAGKKSEALEAYKEIELPDGVSLKDIETAAVLYLNDPQIPVDESGKKIVYSLANFLRNEIYLSYIPHRLRIDLGDRVVVGEYNREDETLQGDDGTDYRLTTSRLAELLTVGKLAFIFGAAA